MWTETNSEKGKSDKAMTREEAKELLLHIFMTYEPKDQYGDYDDPEPYDQALTMAIEALSENISEDGTLKVNVSDASKVKRVMVWGEKSGGLYYPDRPTGEWIDYGDNEYICPFCDYDDIGISEYNFCPNCGADMRGEENDIRKSNNADKNANR